MKSHQTQLLCYSFMGIILISIGTIVRGIGRHGAGGDDIQAVGWVILSLSTALTILDYIKTKNNN